MIFAVGREINVHFQNENDNKTFKDEGWNLYAFSASRLEKGPFHGKKAGKKVLFHQYRLEFYICQCWTIFDT